MKISTALQLFFIASLLPFSLQAQHANQTISYELKHHVISPLRSDPGLFLMGSRIDTFSSVSGAWSHADSAHYTYSVVNTDTLTINAVQLYLDADQTWTNQAQTILQYDASGLDTSNIVQSWNVGDSIWQNAAKTLFGYDANNNNVSIIQYQYDSSGFSASAQTLYQFDASNQLTRQYLLVYNSATAHFDSTQRSDYTYDSLGNKISENDYIYSTSWQNLFQYLSTYDSTNHLTVTIAQVWTGTKFANNYKDSLDYDINNNLIALSRYTWDNQKKIFDFLTTRIESNYNDLNQLTDQTTFYGSDTLWIPLAKATYSYDANGNNTYTLLQGYDASSSSYVNIEQDIFHYVPYGVVGITQVNRNISSVLLYPNPSSNQLLVSLESSRASNAQMQICDIAGHTLSVQRINLIAGKNNFSVDVSKLSNGVYYLKMLNAETREQEVQKIVKQ